ncbi:F-box protein At4g09920-like [Spinacia oleracea]|uniref:F-box protein At4g09920-like n=1 Tax=Spinacia oleracea TaxID=3562 RepID=A0ABM3QZJ8_SPIOL|nr:F-box protein At4g09920-like [Spinacia oleracea]
MKREEEDRLSSLPDDLLINILNRLPIKQVAATHILSHRWSFLWKEVTTLRLVGYLPTYSSFVPISQLMFSQKITAFEFDCSRRVYQSRIYFNDMLRIWVTEICRFRRTKELKLKLELHNRFYLPPIILQTPTIQVLILLDGNFRLNLPSNGIRLPNLIKLQISGNESSLDLQLLNNLLTSCPLLEDVHFQGKIVLKHQIDQHSMPIYAKNLKFLRLYLDIKKKVYGWYNNRPYFRVLIDAPKLEQFHVVSSTTSKIPAFIFLTIPTGLVEARVYIRTGKLQWCNFVNHGLEMIRSIVGIKFLCLSGNVLGPLSCCVSSRNLPILHCLTKLEVGLDNYPTSWIGLKKFVECCPNLKVLVLKRMNSDFRWDELNRSRLVDLMTTMTTTVNVLKLEDDKYDSGLETFFLNIIKDILQIKVETFSTN